MYYVIFVSVLIPLSHAIRIALGFHRQQLLMQTGAVLPQAEPRSGKETAVLHVLWCAPGTLALHLRGRSDSGGNRTRDTLLLVSVLIPLSHAIRIALYGSRGLVV